MPLKSVELLLTDLVFLGSITMSKPPLEREDELSINRELVKCGSPGYFQAEEKLCHTPNDQSTLQVLL